MSNRKRLRLRATSVRARLTILTVIVVIVPALAGIAWTTLSLDWSLTASARDRAVTLSDYAADVLQRDGLSGLQHDREVLSDPVQTVQVIDSSGAVMFATTRAGEHTPLSEQRPAAGEVVVTGDGVTTAPAEPPPLVVARGVAVGSSTYVVVVQASRHPQEEAVEKAGETLLVGLPLILLGVGGLTWFLVGRSLAPVDRIRRVSGEITAGHLDRRVPVPAVQDEVGRLAVTMNDMLDRLERSQRSQRSFVADASHELRSPLTSLRAAIQYGASADDEQAWGELVPLMDRESARLQGLIDDMLTLSKADDAGTIPLRPAGVDLDEVVATEKRRLRVSADVTVTGSIEPVQIIGDEGQLIRLVRNLSDNAARAATSTVALGLARWGADGAVITVEDDGDGIPPADRGRIFERFVRLDDDRSRSGGGSGLGLAIVAEIVRAHGGSIAVDDSPLGGARFTVRLPATPPVPAAESAPAP